MQVYSNGLSEVILGNAIKKLNLPREELVIMTKVGHLFNRTAVIDDCFSYMELSLLNME